MRPSIEGREVGVEDVGAEVVYVPPQADNDQSHPDCEIATIASYTHSHIYVKFQGGFETRHPVLAEHLRWARPRRAWGVHIDEPTPEELNDAYLNLCAAGIEVICGFRLRTLVETVRHNPSTSTEVRLARAVLVMARALLEEEPA